LGCGEWSDTTARPGFDRTGGFSFISMKVARSKKDPKTETWQLYWADRNSKWRPYPPLPYHRDIEKLLKEVEKSEIGVFWG
jgi:hypothetical protein